MSVFIKEPNMFESTRSYLLAPLSYGIWWTLVASVLLLALFLSVTWHLGVRYGNQQQFENYSFWNSWIDVFASFCQQSHATTPRSWSCRLIFLTSYLIAVTVLNAYSTTLISYLAVRTTVLPFTDFRGLLDDGTYKLGIFPQSAQMYYLQNSQDPVLRGVFERLVKPYHDTQPTNDLEGLRRVCENKNYAFLTTQFAVRENSGGYNCTVVEIPDASFQISASIVINKGSHYKRLFAHRIQQMRRDGIMNAIVEKYLSFRVTDDNVKPPESVSLQKMKTLFAVYTTGILVSIVCLLIELKMQREILPRRISFINRTL